MVEWSTVNRLVVGSNPTRGALRQVYSEFIELLRVNQLVLNLSILVSSVA